MNTLRHRGRRGSLNPFCLSRGYTDVAVITDPVAGMKFAKRSLRRLLGVGDTLC